MVLAAGARGARSGALIPASREKSHYRRRVVDFAPPPQPRRKCQARSASRFPPPPLLLPLRPQIDAKEPPASHLVRFDDLFLQICDMAGASPKRGPTLDDLRGRKLAAGALNLVRPPPPPSARGSSRRR